MGVHAKFGLLNRRAIEDEIERLISLLDTADAPFEDLEPELDASPEELTGEGAEAEIYAARPLYGIDQTRPPINLQAAEREHLLRLYTT